MIFKNWINNKSNFRNLAKSLLVEHAILRKEGELSNEGAFLTSTGKYTGRSPKDKFTVCEENTEDEIWWNDGNKKMLPQHAQKLQKKISEHLTLAPRYILIAGLGQVRTIVFV
jgi:phosphoenolpyruvate carboxykinase (ATP)